jgi:hypothetical protein
MTQIARMYTDSIFFFLNHTWLFSAMFLYRKKNIDQLRLLSVKIRQIRIIRVLLPIWLSSYNYFGYCHSGQNDNAQHQI